MKVKILNTKYEIKNDDRIIEEELDGLCLAYDKKILIRNQEKMLSKSDSPEAKRKRYKEVLRHEIIHAFFDESGLEKYSRDEELVDWIAVQFPKMLEIFKNTKSI